MTKKAIRNITSSNKTRRKKKFGDIFLLIINRVNCLLLITFLQFRLFEPNAKKVTTTIKIFYINIDDCMDYKYLKNKIVDLN